MSADNWILLETKTFYVSYGQGDNITKTWSCDNLEEAVKMAKALDEEYHTEYGVKLI
jgi:hypothetical protein